MPENFPYSSSPSVPVASPTADEDARRYYYAQWQQYYSALWQQYYAQMQMLYGSHYRPAQIQQTPQPMYSHGGELSKLPEPPRAIRRARKEVFISYSTKNPREASFVCRKLEEAGMRCWIAPRDLLPGTNFADNIEAALANARLLVLILSHASATSPWVEGEINTAFSAGLPILVYRIDDVMPDGSLKVMIENFPTLSSVGDLEQDAGTLVYNAMIFTGRTKAPEGYDVSAFSSARSTPPTKNPEAKSEAPKKNAPAVKPAARKTSPRKPETITTPRRSSSSKTWIFVAAVVLWTIIIIATARFWFPWIAGAAGAS